MKNKKRTAWIIFFIVAIIVIISLVAFFNNIIPRDIKDSNKIAVISIKGPITSNDGDSDGFFYQNTITSSSLVGFIESANKDKNIKGIILNINSPGGSVVATKEVVDSVKKVDKPIVALIREVGASGAYWIASATDVIIADPLSITGSIGVLGSYLEFSDLMKKYGVEYQNIKTGEYKDLGNQFVDLTPQGKKILEGKLNIIHKYFLDDVNRNRKKDLTQYANGLFYLGTEAKEIGLIDELGGKEEAIAIVKKLAGVKEEPELVFYKSKKSIFDILNRVFNDFGFSIGRGIGKEFAIQENFDIKLE